MMNKIKGSGTSGKETLRYKKQNTDHVKPSIGTGIDTVLKHAEEHVYESAINALNSPEMDNVIRDSVNSVFDSMRKEIATKEWHHNLGLGKVPSPLYQNPPNAEKL